MLIEVSGVVRGVLLFELEGLGGLRSSAMRWRARDREVLDVVW